VGGSGAILSDHDGLEGDVFQHHPSMQSLSSPDRLYVRLSDDLAALLGCEEVFEDELLDALREALESLSTLAQEVRGARHSAPHRVGVVRVSRGAGVAARRVLAALLVGRPGDDVQLLRGLRERGFITYPSPLLGSLLEDPPELFEEEVLKNKLSPSDRAVFSQVSRGCRAAVVSSRLPLAGRSEGVPLLAVDFFRSVERLAWARENGCPCPPRLMTV